VPVLLRRHLAVASLPSLLSYLPSGFWRGWRMSRTQVFDVINTHFVVPTGPVGDWLARALRVPNVLSVHGGDLYDPSKKSSPHRHSILRHEIAKLLRRADRVVAQSRDTARNVTEIYGVSRHVELVPLGIERPVYDQTRKSARSDLPGDAFVLVTVGRMVARKANAQLIDTLAAIQNAVLLIVGDGPDAENVARLAAERGVSARLRMLGHTDDEQKFRALSAADVFVSTSQHEGFGLVFLEAMAFGLPIVCYDRGGQTDFLTTPTTGEVVRLNDLQRFTQAVIALRDDPARRQRIREHNLRKVEEFYIEHCAERYERLFEEVVDRAPPRAHYLEHR
jgi:glycosyltransferase involved in cell wall biosynthesis